MAIAHIVSTSKASDGSNCTTDAVNTTGASSIEISVADYDGNPAAAPTCNMGNVWVPRTRRTNSTVGEQLYYAVPPIFSGPGHTFSVVGQFASLAVSAFSSVKTSSPYDQENGSATLQTGSVTPSEDNELIVAGLGFYLSDTVSIDSGFTIGSQIDFVNGASWGNCIAYKIQTTAGAVNPTFSGAGGFPGGGAASSIITLKAAGSPFVKINGLWRRSSLYKRPF